MAHNLNLSQQRAHAVVTALTTRFGVEAASLSAKGVATFAAIASDETEAGRTKNRRVEMVTQ